MAVVWKRAHTVAVSVAAVAVVAGAVTIATTAGPGEPQTAPSVSDASSTPRAPGSSVSTSPTPESRPTDPLTGAEVSDHEVFAVKVENIALARPQVGLHAADIVFIEEVEGAQTRLVAIYHTRFPKAVEPVRSARSTDVQLLPLFGKPGLVYSGANARVQRKIDAASIVPIYRATRDPRRVAPHNVRVNLAKVAASEKVAGAKPIGWTFSADDERLVNADRAATAKVTVGHDTFGFGYAKGRYTVRWNGRTYADGDDGTIAKTDNVVVMSVHNHPDGNRDVLGSASVQSDTVGRGTVVIYRDGKKLNGTWSRSDVAAPLRLTDASGRDIALKPGQTWVALRG